MNFKTLVYSFIAVLLLISCDNETSGLGSSLTPEDDVITVKADSSFAASRTIVSPDSLIIMTSQCNLGRFTDPASGAGYESGYLTQLNCMENFTMADSIYGIGNHMFPEWFDSAVAGQKPYYANLKLFYTGYFGDPANAIKIEVFPLDRMIDADKAYYPSVDPSEFCNTSAQPIASITVSGRNMQQTDSLRAQSSYYPCITIPLPDSLAKVILEAYDNPDTRYYFSGAKSFMENLVKGFYVRCSQGDGTVIYVDYSVLEVNFKYISYEDSEPKVMSLMAEFPGNTEVLQFNAFKWTNLDSQLADNSGTWIRSPFGVLTEITLPVDEMRDDKYVLNSAMLRIPCAITPSSYYKPSVPSSLLLVRKDLLKDFMSRNNMVDKIESFVSTYSTKYGTYTYDNIAALIEKMYSDRAEWLTQNNMTLENGKAAYEAARPDWNKVVLVPVTADVNSSGSAINYTLDIKLHQAKLIGGTDGKLTIKTIRSKF